MLAVPSAPVERVGRAVAPPAVFIMADVVQTAFLVLQTEGREGDSWVGVQFGQNVISPERPFRPFSFNPQDRRVADGFEPDDAWHSSLHTLRARDSVRGFINIQPCER